MRGRDEKKNQGKVRLRADGERERETEIGMGGSKKYKGEEESGEK